MDRLTHIQRKGETRSFYR